MKMIRLLLNYKLKKIEDIALYNRYALFNFIKIYYTLAINYYTLIIYIKK